MRTKSQGKRVTASTASMPLAVTSHRERLAKVPEVASEALVAEIYGLPDSGNP